MSDNKRPLVVLDRGVYEGVEGESIRFNFNQSYDQDGGEIRKYKFLSGELDDAGKPTFGETTPLDFVEWTYSKPGNFDASLIVVDDEGTSSTRVTFKVLVAKKGVDPEDLPGQEDPPLPPPVVPELEPQSPEGTRGGRIVLHHHGKAVVYTVFPWNPQGTGEQVAKDGRNIGVVGSQLGMAGGKVFVLGREGILGKTPWGFINPDDDKVYDVKAPASQWPASADYVPQPGPVVPGDPTQPPPPPETSDIVVSGPPVTEPDPPLSAYVIDFAKEYVYKGKHLYPDSNTRPPSGGIGTRFDNTNGIIAPFTYQGDTFMFVTNSATGGGDDDQITLIKVNGLGQRGTLVKHFGQVLASRKLQGNFRNWCRVTGAMVVKVDGDLVGVLWSYRDTYNAAGFDDPNKIYTVFDLRSMTVKSIHGPFATRSTGDKPAHSGMTATSIFRVGNRIGYHGAVDAGNHACAFGANLYLGDVVEFESLKADVIQEVVGDKVVPRTEGALKLDPTPLWHSIKYRQRRNADYTRCEYVSRVRTNMQGPYIKEEGAVEYPGMPYWAGLDVVACETHLDHGDGRTALIAFGHMCNGHVWYGPFECAHGLSGWPMSTSVGDAASEHTPVFFNYDMKNLGFDPLPQKMKDLSPAFAHSVTKLKQYSSVHQVGNQVWLSEIIGDNVTPYQVQPQVHVFERKP